MFWGMALRSGSNLGCALKVKVGGQSRGSGTVRGAKNTLAFGAQKNRAGVTPPGSQFYSWVPSIPWVAWLSQVPPPSEATRVGVVVKHKRHSSIERVCRLGKVSGPDLATPR